MVGKASDGTHVRVFCKHAEMASQGSASARFQRAIARGNLFQAELAAREMDVLNLSYALDLCRLMASEGDLRFERAAVRWHGRFVIECGVERINESQLVLAALAELPHASAAVEPLLRQFRRRGGVL